MLINRREKVGNKNLKNPMAFIDYPQITDDIMLIVFDDIIEDIEANKKLSSTVTELILRGRKLNISFTFTSQSYFKVPKITRLNAKHCFIRKIPKQRELQQISSDH